ncbi:MAG TPA: DUF420 domain-containing protein [Tepidisphaeraceae bacterium]|nr:DUF420 domain-containing protein [Tepidisphaeraceae bacterium]
MRSTLLALVPLLLLATAAGAAPINKPGDPPSFAATAHDDRPFTGDDLKGKITVFYFFFTNCGGPCPMMTQRMVSLARKAPGDDLQFVGISVDPERDTPAVLRQYASQMNATDPRIRFLTAPSNAAVQQVGQQMAVAVGEAKAGQQDIMHSQRFLIFDRQGRMRATAHPMESTGIDEAIADIAFLRSEKPKHPLIDVLPPVNASLNALAAILMCIGLGLALSGRYTAHAWLMCLALLASTVFLACYLTLHYLKAQSGAGLTKFPEHSARPVYMGILLSHTILAIVVLPMIITTVIFAWKRKWAAHRKLAKPTFWIWLYVSVTGVVVYWMLYQLAPRIAASATV